MIVNSKNPYAVLEGHGENYPMPMILATLTLAWHGLEDRRLDLAERFSEAAEIASTSLIGIEFHIGMFDGKPEDRVMWIADKTGDRIEVYIRRGQYCTDHMIEFKPSRAAELLKNAEIIAIDDDGIPAFMAGLEVELD
jgi:hypothetical protein